MSFSKKKFEEGGEMTDATSKQNGERPRLIGTGKRYTFKVNFHTIFLDGMNIIENLSLQHTLFKL